MISKFRKYRLLEIAIAFLPITLLLYLFQTMDLRVNVTPSMRTGLYQQQRQTTTLHHGDVVSFCLPKPIALAGKSRDYIGNGTCPGNTMPLLKQVIALPGDTVTLTSNAIIVNGKHYLAPQQKYNHQNQRIIRWVKNGIYYDRNTVWVYGSHDPIHSWDLRYFGGIPVKNILGIYKPIWVIK